MPRAAAIALGLAACVVACADELCSEHFGDHHDGLHLLQVSQEALGKMVVSAENNGIERHVPSELMPDFQVPTHRGDITYKRLGGEAREKFFPMVIMVVDYTDPFLSYMAEDPVSLRDFLSLDPLPEANFLFLFDGKQGASAGQARFKASIDSQLKQLSSEANAFWSSHLYYGNSTLSELRAAGGLLATVPEVLDSFPYIRKYLWFKSEGQPYGVNLPRLDCNFQWSLVQGPNNHSPENPVSSELVYVPNGCHAVKGSVQELNSKFALVLEDELENCTAEDAVRHLAQTFSGLTGVILMARQGSQLRVIGEEESTKGVAGPITTGTLATMISFNELFVGEVRKGPLPISYGFNESSPGSFVAIDAEGSLQEIGHAINPWLRIVGWVGQFWAYRKALQQELAKPAVVTPIMSSLVGMGTVTVNLSAFYPFRDGPYSKLYLDATLSCTGLWNMDCPIWDHVASVSVHCNASSKYNLSGGSEPGGSFAELARYVTPYRLRVGRWSTDVTPLAPLLRVGSGFCNFTVTTPPWGADTWVWSFALRATREAAAGAGATSSAGGLPAQGTKLFSNNEPLLRPVFNADYNRDRERRVSIPSGTRRVELVAMITGHGEDEMGCCEFLPSRHVFTLGGKDFAVDFMAPLDLFGCTAPSQGVAPNGYGGWWMGRNGWCNGQDVKPWVVDVTSAVLGSRLRPSNDILASYTGLMWNSTSREWVEPYAVSGYILMSSHLAFYI